MGLEVHVTLKSEKKVFNLKKLFSGEDNQNDTTTGSWELGYLGDLPFLNYEIVELAIKTCSALNCKTSKKIVFDRKIYSYFDLPKGFQITQEREPIGRNGYLPVFIGEEIIDFPISKVQIEEDTAKSSYKDEEVILDFRRAGNPLLEIVTEPIFNDIESLICFAKQLRALLTYLEISDAKMELGQFRMDMNFSLEINNGKYKSPRYEVKNLNSFKNLRNSFEQVLEQERKDFLEKKYNISNLNKTLGYNETKQEIFFQREKSSYFYVEEHNIIPISIKSKDLLAISPKIKDLPWNFLKKIKIKQKEKIAENTEFIKAFKILSRRKKSLEKIEKVTSFILNHVIPSFNSYEGKEFSFEEKVEKMRPVLEFWCKKKTERNKVNNTISKIIKENDYFFIESDLLQENVVFVNHKNIEKEIFRIFQDEKNKKKIKKIIFDKSKSFSFVFGKLKESFSEKNLKREKVQSAFESAWKKLNT